MRILLVEDDESLRDVFQLILETEQPVPELKVETAASGGEAIEHISAQVPDLVLLDMTLANESGFEVIEKLKRLPNCAALPVVAVTAHNLKELEEQALKAGFSGFITKPIDFEKGLFPLLRSLLNTKKTGHAA